MKVWNQSDYERLGVQDKFSELRLHGKIKQITSDFSVSIYRRDGTETIIKNILIKTITLPYLKLS